MERYNCTAKRGVAPLSTFHDPCLTFFYLEVDESKENKMFIMNIPS